MPANIYEQIQQLLTDLTREERKQLLEELTSMVDNDQKRPLHDVIEFRGVAKDFWRDTDVEEYIRQERDSWDIEPSRYYNDTHFESDKR